MKRLFLSGWAALALAATVWGVDLRSAATHEEFSAAGLAKLSPAELQALEQLFERLKAADATSAAAGGSPLSPALPKKGPSWLGALLTLEKAGQGKGEAEALQSRLAGPLKSFSGRRSFTLENGQQWQMIESEQYAGPTYQNPEVFIEPGIMGTFWLRIPDGAVRVKVKPLKLQ